MLGLLLHWILCALALLIVSRVVPGFHVNGLWPAMIASLVIGLLNATVGLFLLVINGLMIMLASGIVRGFYVRGFMPAFIGAIVLALLGMVIRAMTRNA